MSNASERILVAGAGVAGGEVLRQLAAAIRTACALVRNPQRAAPFRKLGVKLIEGDFANKDSWQRALDGVAAVFNITVAHRDAVAWNAAFLDRAKQSEVRHERVAVVTRGISSANERMR
jgi:uncharacterized protein YbjT (DUF2867 family)